MSLGLTAGDRRAQVGIAAFGGSEIAQKIGLEFGDDPPGNSRHLTHGLDARF
jgi:hypothetical protein